jgi:hypothetical protein
VKVQIVRVGKLKKNRNYVANIVITFVSIFCTRIHYKYGGFLPITF